VNLLAIETSTDACSVALAVGDERLVDHRVAPRRHGELVLPMIDALLAEAALPTSGLDGIAFGRGPGSFTGVRVAASVTQGIALGLDIGVVGVSTLRTIAQGCLRELDDARVGVALDARLDEIYWGAFRASEAGVMTALVDERVCLPRTLTLGERGDGDRESEGSAEAEGGRDEGRWRLAGAGAERYAATLLATLGLDDEESVRASRLPNALDTLALAVPLVAENGLGPPESAVPVYLRERVALTERERGTARGSFGG